MFDVQSLQCPPTLRIRFSSNSQPWGAQTDGQVLDPAGACRREGGDAKKDAFLLTSPRGSFETFLAFARLGASAQISSGVVL